MRLRDGGGQSKLLGLELLRFVAAFAVLVWHYQHFAFDGAAIAIERERQPLYALLRPFYEYGWYGVQVFWSISGFIFFWRYRDSVAAKALGPRQFFVLRFSRLYPLHFASLLLVALLQWTYTARAGHHFVYPHNDGFHFLLQLFMASNWGWQAGYSFNGPIWSISVEVLVYAMFFAGLRLAGRSAWVSLAALALSAGLHQAGLATPVSECIGLFYAGGLGAMLFAHAGRRLSLLAWAVALGAPAGLLLAPAPPAAAVFYLALAYAPFALYCLAQPLALGRRAAHLVEAAGNLTYASYLLHFPLQLAIALYFAGTARPIPVYGAPLFLGFILASFGLAWLTYRYLELPAQQWLRRRLGTERAPRHSSAGV